MTTPDQARVAFLDALAEGESTGTAAAAGISPYFVLYGGGSFEHLPCDATGFPIWPGKDNSHAAGRYQFEPGTWYEMAHKLGLRDFSPASQDEAAWALAEMVYYRVLWRALLADLLTDNLGYVAQALHSTWTSLSLETFASRYRAAMTDPQRANWLTPPPNPTQAARTAVPVDAPREFPYTIHQGQTDESVRDVQRELGIIQDAVFGRETAAAVRAFQTAHGLAVTGGVDWRTWNALMGIKA